LLRIIGGVARGRQLKTPSGTQTRPSGARLRKSLFDVLAPRIEGSHFLDLFAGSGAIGLEALSRGAASATFVECDRDALMALRRNLEALGFGERAVVVGKAWPQALGMLDGKYDLIFADPPYSGGLVPAVLESLGEAVSMGEGAVVMAQCPAGEQAPASAGRLRLFRGNQIGRSVVYFYRAEPSAQEVNL
jgi:16S rRNA (guanine966-N2)-methyltransferase